jgi:hypothetical protein
MTEGWGLLNVFDEPHGSTGLSTTAVPTNGRLALTMPYNAGTSTTLATTRLIVPLCNGVTAVQLTGKTLQADLRFVSASPHTFLQVPGSVQTGGDPNAGVGNFQFCDFFLDDGASPTDTTPQGAVHTISCSNLAASTYVIIYFSAQSNTPWVGTVYLDNVQIR